MTPMRWFYAAFWIFLAVALFWQFTSYNASLDHAQAEKGPQQQHFYFLPNSTDTTTANASPAHVDGAVLKQVAFKCEAGVPNQFSLTCHVYLKNEGNQRATGIQVEVRPYNGSTAPANGPSEGRDDMTPTNYNDPATQVSQWVAFPDIDPGQTVSQDAVFGLQQGYNPGSNPSPQITFKSVAPQPARPPPTAPPTL